MMFLIYKLIITVIRNMCSIQMQLFMKTRLNIYVSMVDTIIVEELDETLVHA